MSITVKVINQSGAEVKELALNENVFGIEPNNQAMFDAVVMQQASLRQGTAKTKGRSEVSATGKKSIRQKGTGGARHAQKSAPTFVGGGVVFGPQPRKYGYKLNRKIRRLALRSYLSTFAAEGKLVVVDKIAMDEIKTAKFVEIMKNMNLDRKVLFAFDDAEDWENVWMSMRNLQNASFSTASGLNCLDMANAYTLVLTEEAVKSIEEALQ